MAKECMTRSILLEAQDSFVALECLQAIEGEYLCAELAEVVSKTSKYAKICKIVMLD